MITLGLKSIVVKRLGSSPTVLPSESNMVDLRGPSAAALQALSETVAWCLSEASQHSQLRSRELDPSAILEVPSIDEIGVEAVIRRTRESYHQAVGKINRTRSALLRDAGIEVADPKLAQSRGRLLLYEPLETVTCGASEASSHGFFDGEDAPPWDTWFLYAGGTIFSWVPHSLLGDAQAGIDANPVDCIHWCEWDRFQRLATL